MIEEWDITPANWKKNFKCWLSNKGRWRLEKGIVYGKWIFNIKPNENITAPTFGDQRNFLTGLLEADKRNDEFLFENGESRPSQLQDTIRKFKVIIDKFQKREGDKLRKTY